MSANEDDFPSHAGRIPKRSPLFRRETPIKSYVEREMEQHQLAQQEQTPEGQESNIRASSILDWQR